MKIGVIVDNEFNSDTRVKNETELFDNHKLNYAILCLGYKNSLRHDRETRISRMQIPRKIKDILYATDNTFRLYSLFWKRAIKRFIKLEHITHLHVHDLYMAIPALWATKNSSVKVVLDLHENYPFAVEGYTWTKKFPHKLFAHPKTWKKIEGTLLKSVTKIIVLSDTFQQDLQAKYPELKNDQFIVYPNVPSPDELMPIASTTMPSNDRFTLFYFGVIARRRGIFFVIEQLKKLVAEFPQLHLKIIGPVDKAERETFMQLIQAPELQSHINYTPWIKVEELPQYTNEVDLALSPLENNPQHNSGVANKVFQYMALELPLLVSDCTPQKKLVEANNCGWVYQANNAKSFRSAVKSAIESSDLYQKGKNGRKAILEKYNTLQTGSALVDYYNTERKIYEAKHS